ncbi:MAG TPA: UDP-N-acetylmuramoyl-L-alanyl-D-glutamate--2,6-diaminopimelate ligase [bacterium]|nr:UDP-N-acetylmuramoyl-L-alanyl-D-glutamate--2,6-diaminopimelate ligase [bacterium]
MIFDNVRIVETCGEIPASFDRIVYDSRQVCPGALFVALRGKRTDGHGYLAQAFASGASAALVEKIPHPAPGPCLRVQNTLAALPLVAAAFYGNPSHDLTVAAITGSNGKTSTTYLVEAMWIRAGFPCAVIGTIEYRWKNRLVKATNTTPLSLDLQRMLAEIREDDVRHVAMEVSSHALRLHRVDGIRFRTATFTNLSPEHLDFHRDMDDYREAKALLFTDHLASNGLGVINTDDQNGRTIYERLNVRNRLSFALDSPSDIAAREYSLNLEGTGFLLHTPSWDRWVQSPLLGEHNLRNLLGAAATGFALGLSEDAIVGGIESVRNIPGRLESIPNNRRVQILVDYAHTPDGLEQVLSTIASLPHGRLVTVFGCGGDRDRTKRPVMGRIALKYSDQVIVTSDNPRTEDPISIIAEIEKGMTTGKERYKVIPDRREAIRYGLEIAGQNDVLLVAGKGHETTQTIGTVAYPFDDREIIRGILAE